MIQALSPGGRLATAPGTPMCTVIHGGKFTGGAHPPN